MSMIRIGNRLLSISAIGECPSLIRLADVPVSPPHLGRTGLSGVKSHPYHFCYGQRLDRQRLLALSSPHIRSFHSSPILFDDKSKIEKTVDLLKDKAEGDKIKSPTTSATPSVAASVGTVATTPPAGETTVAVKRKTLWQRIVHELKHYYNGFKLLFIETKIAFRLLRQVLNGHNLTRRERKQVRHGHTLSAVSSSLTLVHSHVS